MGGRGLLATCCGSRLPEAHAPDVHLLWQLARSPGPSRLPRQRQSQVCTLGGLSAPRASLFSLAEPQPSDSERTGQRPVQGPGATSSLSYANSLSLERDRVFTLMRKTWKEGERSPAQNGCGCYCRCLPGDYSKHQLLMWTVLQTVASAGPSGQFWAPHF